MKRVGILTSGGDCQGLNAAIRGVCRALYESYDEYELEIYGIIDGYKGLINGECRLMRVDEFSGILTQGGTILGTSRQPFKQIRDIDEDGINKIEEMKRTYKKLKLDCLVVLGGNGSQKTANLLSEEGLNIVSLPKTIDNDLWGTDITFGFQSAVDIATNVIDCIHTTAMSHSRIFIVELMGHKAGWLTLHAGIASGADIILIPEIPYKLDDVVRDLEKRNKQGKNYSILAVAEGAIPKEYAKLPKKERKEAMENMNHPTISYKLADDLQKSMGQEVRVAVPGHFQRGGSPCPYDRVLATRFGTEAARLIRKENYGRMVSMKDGEIKSVSLKGIAGKLKLVPTDSSIIECARDIGIGFGD